MTNVHGISVSGGSFPAQIWRRFMDPALAGLPAREFPEPAQPVVFQSGIEGRRRSPTTRTTWLLRARRRPPRRRRRRPRRRRTRRRRIRRRRRRTPRRRRPPRTRAPVTEAPPRTAAAPRAVTSRSAPLAAGVATACLVGVASATAWRDGSPLVPREGGLAEQGTARLFLVLVAAAFVAYLAGSSSCVAVRSRSAPRSSSRPRVQLVPLAAPLLLSTDAWTYWGYGWIAAEGGGNPYVDPPSAFPESPAAPYLGADWRDTTSVYGPAFTLVSEPVARIAGSSADAAAWLFKSLAALAVLVATVAVSRSSRRPALAAAFVGWNPVLAIHAGGGGHNDALVGALVATAVALGVHRRSSASGAVWALAALFKWVPLVFFALAALAARARGRSTGALGPRRDPRRRRRGRHVALRPPLARRARPARRQRGASDELCPSLAARAARPPARGGSRDRVRPARSGARLARPGRTRRARAARVRRLPRPRDDALSRRLVPRLGGAPRGPEDDDRLARLAALGLTAYLLPQTIPLIEARARRSRPRRTPTR